MTVYLQDADVTLHHGDVLEVLRELPAESVHMCVTSPPFYGLRDYGTGAWEGGDEGCDHVSGMARQDTDRDTPGGKGGSFRGGEVQFRDLCGKCGARRVDQQIGLEETPEQWADKLVAVFREVRRVLRADGTLWLEVGDSYASSWPCNRRNVVGEGSLPNGKREARPPRLGGDLKEKDLIGAPWALAFALRADGWWLRSEIIWAKPNPMPESVSDRPTTAHSRIFLLAKQPRYFFDAEAVREPHTGPTFTGRAGLNADGYDDPSDGSMAKPRDAFSKHRDYNPSGRNVRSVWEIATEAFSEAHFATFPTKLVTRCILAGSSERGCCPECGAPWGRQVERERGDQEAHMRPKHTQSAKSGLSLSGNGSAEWAERGGRVTTIGWRPTCDCVHTWGSVLGAAEYVTVPATILDPFIGSGTTALVARKLGRRCIGIDLSEPYLQMASRRLAQQSLFATEVA